MKPAEFIPPIYCVVDSTTRTILKARDTRAEALRWQLLSGLAAKTCIEVF